MKKQDSVKNVNKLYNQIFSKDFFEDEEFAAYAEKITGEETIAETWTIPLTLKPRFLTKKQIKIAKEGAEAIIRGLVDIEKELKRGNRELQKFMGLSDEEIEILKLPCLYKHPFPFIRFDSTLINNSWKAIEINLNFPGFGGGLDDVQIDFSKLKTIKKLAKLTSIEESKKLDPKLCSILLDCYRESGISSKPNPQVLVLKRPDFDFQDSRNLAKHLTKAGYKAEVADAQNLKYDGKNLSCRGFKANLFLKWFDFHPHRDSIKNYPALISAIKDKKAIMVNSFGAAVMAAKTSFAVMTSQRFKHLFSKKEQDIFKKSVPWTRFFKDEIGDTISGTKVNLKEYALKNKDKVVLKPVNGTCGKGVYVGIAHSRTEWQKIVHKVLIQKRNFIIQERVQILEEIFPVVKEGKLYFEKRKVDFLPYILSGKFHTSFSRCARGYILNAYRGAIIALNYTLNKQI